MYLGKVNQKQKSKVVPVDAAGNLLLKQK